jgi:hypothetical protein
MKTAVSADHFFLQGQNATCVRQMEPENVAQRETQKIRTP